MEIYQVLKEDHKVIKALIKKLDDTTERSHSERLNLLGKLKEILIPHARAEEQVFYESLKDSSVKEAVDIAFEGYEEHAVADHLLMEIDQTDPKDKRWGALMSVLKESIEHHIEEEEEEIFSKAHKSFESDLAEEMAIDYLSLKDEYLADLKAGNPLPQPTSHSL